ncbi:hypothetical protein LJC11_02015 [Bacteroidales bacterium OttesenSCG-928-I21]|nr:hypothetical protein [Bacteroidales bacterium OttesenSCG-928-I21]
MKTAEKTVKKKKAAKQATEKISAKDRIKPRGLWGIMKGKIHYDENADIFNLGL